MVELFLPVVANLLSLFPISKNVILKNELWKGSLGTGLGLYICKEIVNKLKGDIAIQSTPGIGTSIKIIIPLSK